MRKFFKTTAVTFISIGLPVASANAETYEAASKGMGMTENEVFPIAEGHVVVKSATTYESFEVDAGHPLEGATGSCFGSFNIMGANVSGAGNCIFDTTAGDKAVMSWNATGMGADGALTGDWAVAGGSGNWATASGGGTFSSLTDPDTGKFVNTITGSMTID